MVRIGGATVACPDRGSEESKEDSGCVKGVERRPPIRGVGSKPRGHIAAPGGVLYVTGIALPKWGCRFQLDHSI